MMTGMPPKILYVHHTGANGGATMSLFYLIEEARKTHEVVVYFLADGPAVDFYRKAGIRVLVEPRLAKYPHCTIEYQCLNPLKWKFYRDAVTYARHTYKQFLAVSVTRRILEREAPDIVHLNSTVLLAEGIAANKCGVPVVWHLRDFLERGSFGLRRAVASRIIRKNARVIVGLCEAEGRRLGDTSKVVVIPNFVDLTRFNPEQAAPVGLRDKAGWPDDAKVVAMLGWNTPAKGARVAVEAMRKVVASVPAAKLLLLGTGTPPEHPGPSRRRGFALYRELRRLIGESALNGSVSFGGTAFNIRDYLAEIDIVVVPFLAPHFARPILEAGAMRKVVVTSDIDGTREMVLDGQAGYLARAGDSDSLADAILGAIRCDNSTKIAALYENVRLNYNAEVNAGRTIALYRDCLNPEVGQR